MDARFAETTNAHDAAPDFILPDVIAPSLRVVFCGTAPGRVSAQKRQYYAHRGNKFWRILNVAGLTPRQLGPEQYSELLSYGIGLTDLAKNAFGMDHRLPRDSLGATAKERLEKLIKSNAPKFLAFTSIRAGRTFFGHRRDAGRQPEQIGFTKI